MFFCPILFGVSHTFNSGFRDSVARPGPGQLKLDPEDVSMALEFNLGLLFMQVRVGPG
jgi:hypothetical protein